ncbi:hypothetical protein BGW37DRAFT_96584 [Umbelopsis sp. PMI_123]|nr:hypothetical protein BGW37DRAFT_96584 [Umbelopsis sp. PMI_123]
MAITAPNEKYFFIPVICHSVCFVILPSSFTMDYLSPQASPPSNTTMHWSAHHHTEDKLDVAVEQLLRIYNNPDSALTPPSHNHQHHHHQHHHQHHHHRTLSVDLGNGERRPHRASTSWLNTNAGFEPQIYRAKDNTRPTTKTFIDYTPPASPKQPSKTRRVVTFEDEVVKDDTSTLPTPPSSPVTRDKPVSPDNTTHRQNRLLALLHLEKPNILLKRSTR